MMYVKKAGRMAALSLPALLATPLHASVYPLPADGSPVVGTDTSMQTVYEDTLPDLAHRYSLGYYEIIRANPGVDVWLPGAGTKLLLPGRRILPAGPRVGLVVNLPEHRLYYYPKPRKVEQPVVITYPVSIGKMVWRTPLGETGVSCCSKRIRRWTPKARASSRTCSCCRRCSIRRSAATPPPSTGIWRVPRSRPPAAFRRWWVLRPKRRPPSLPPRAYCRAATEGQRGAAPTGSLRAACRPGAMRARR